MTVFKKASAQTDKISDGDIIQVIKNFPFNFLFPFFSIYNFVIFTQDFSTIFNMNQLNLIALSVVLILSSIEVLAVPANADSE